jgi:hypothetical protein
LRFGRHIVSFVEVQSKLRCAVNEKSITLGQFFRW